MRCVCGWRAWANRVCMCVCMHFTKGIHVVKATPSASGGVTELYWCVCSVSSVGGWWMSSGTTALWQSAAACVNCCYPYQNMLGEL
jgi:hypothetical protein